MLEMLAHRRLPEGTDPDPFLGLLAFLVVLALVVILL